MPNLIRVADATALASGALAPAHPLEAEPGEVHHAVDEELAPHLRVVAPPDRKRLHGPAQLGREHFARALAPGLRLLGLRGLDRLARHQTGDRQRRLLLQALEQLRDVGLE